LRSDAIQCRFASGHTSSVPFAGPLIGVGPCAALGRRREGRQRGQMPLPALAGLRTTDRPGADSHTGARSCLRTACNARCSTCRMVREARRCTHRRGARTSLLMRPFDSPSANKPAWSCRRNPRRRNLRFRGARNKPGRNRTRDGVQLPGRLARFQQGQ